MDILHLSPLHLFDLNFYGQQVMNVMFLRHSLIFEEDISNHFVVRKATWESYPPEIPKEQWQAIQIELASLLKTEIIIENYREVERLNSIVKHLRDPILHVPFFLDIKTIRRFFKKKKQQVPVWIELNIMPEQAFKKGGKRKSSLRAVSECKEAFLMGVSRAVVTAYKSFVKKEIELVENGIEMSLYHVLNPHMFEIYREAMGLKGKRVVAFVARPERWKGWPVMAELLKRFERERRDDIVFLFAFSPTYPYRPIKQTYIDRAKETFSELKFLSNKGLIRVYVDLSKFFHFDEKMLSLLEDAFRQRLSQTKAHVEELFKNRFVLSPWFYGPLFHPITDVADVLLHPAFAEAYGLVIREALMSGAFVVASKVGGIPFITSKENSILVEDKRLSYAKERFLSDEERKELADKFYEALNRAFKIKPPRLKIRESASPGKGRYMYTFSKTVEYLKKLRN